MRPCGSVLPAGSRTGALGRGTGPALQATAAAGSRPAKAGPGQTDGARATAEALRLLEGVRVPGRERRGAYCIDCGQTRKLL